MQLCRVGRETTGCLPCAPLECFLQDFDRDAGRAVIRAGGELGFDSSGRPVRVVD